MLMVDNFLCCVLWLCLYPMDLKICCIFVIKFVSHVVFVLPRMTLNCGSSEEFD